MNESDERLVAFLYTLIRDCVTPGEIERIMRDHVEGIMHTGNEYTNKHLEQYARSLVERLKDDVE